MKFTFLLKDVFILKYVPLFLEVVFIMETNLNGTFATKKKINKRLVIKLKINYPFVVLILRLFIWQYFLSFMMAQDAIV